MIENHYYPFGLQISGLSFNKTQPKNKYLYNGKELQNDFELGWYDFHSRYYDPTIGRTTTLDPHVENYYDWSPYHFVANNPVRVTDPTGKDWETEKDKKTADTMQKGLKNREASLNKLLTKLENKAKAIKSNDKFSAKKKEKKLADNAKRQESIKSSIREVKTAQIELNIMGETDKMTFSFNNLGSNATIGYLSAKSNGTIVINYTGTLGNQAHEAKHAFQAFTGMISVKAGTRKISVSSVNRYNFEVQAYQRQFSITGGSSFPNSDAGSVRYYKDINENWVKGVNVNGKYLYK